jgi:hypothetical protein
MTASLILTAVIALAGLTYILTPLRRSTPAPAAPGPRDHNEREDLIERRDSLLRELKDLEFEHEMGKIDSEDYATMQAAAADRTAEVLRRLKATRATGGDFRQWRARLWEVEAEAEILIARSRHKLAGEGVNESWKCAECGRVMAAADRFCGSCGTRKP